MERSWMEGVYIKGISLPADNHDLLFSTGNGAFNDGVTLTTLNVSLRAADVHSTVALKNVEFLKRIKSGSVFDVTGTDIKARWNRWISIGLSICINHHLIPPFGYTPLTTVPN
jgi:hypothetical protein